VSRDPDFKRKIHDVLGLCVYPPDHAVTVAGGEQLTKHPDRTFRFTPASASWTNAVFDSLDECIVAVEGCIENRNESGARPFRWRKKPEEPLASWKRERHVRLLKDCPGSAPGRFEGQAATVVPRSVRHLSSVELRSSR